MTHKDAQAVLDFWFRDHTHDDWFGGEQAFDAKVRIAFADTLVQAERCELSKWRTTAEGRVAEIIVLDQFTRQLYRGSGRAFASDPLALALAQELIAKPEFAGLTQDQRTFALMPFMHSESLAIHREAVPLYEEFSDEHTLEFLHKHTEVLERFGRYPKRNEALGRVSTKDEIAYIADRSDSMF